MGIVERYRERREKRLSSFNKDYSPDQPRDENGRFGEVADSEKDGAREGTVAQGKDISSTWQRRSDEFSFAIDDAINAQGFDGKPKVVSAKEFEDAVKEANGGKGLVAQRTYSAADQETLDAYRRELYDGKWYVDCSEGGSAYGQGMYGCVDMNGNLSDGIKNEIRDYMILNGKKSGGQYASDEEKSRMVESYIKNKGLSGDKERAVRSFLQSQVGLGHPSKEEISVVKRELGNEGMKELRTTAESIKYSFSGAKSHIETFTMSADAKIGTYNEIGREMRERGMKGDVGVSATLLGYDAIHVESSNYIIVLNRTKVIFKEP